MGKNDGKNPKEITLADVIHDMKLMAQAATANNKIIMARLEAMESMGRNAGNDEDEDFDTKDKRKALSVLAQQVFNPDDKMLFQMTETPPRMVMSLVIEHTMNEFIKEQAFNPNSKVLLSDIFMKWYAIIMRSLRRQLIQESMGFSQIEMEKAIEEGRGLEATGEE